MNFKTWLINENQYLDDLLHNLGPISLEIFKDKLKNGNNEDVLDIKRDIGLAIDDARQDGDINAAEELLNYAKQIKGIEVIGKKGEVYAFNGIWMSWNSIVSDPKTGLANSNVEIVSPALMGVVKAEVKHTNKPITNTYDMRDLDGSRAKRKAEELIEKPPIEEPLTAKQQEFARKNPHLKFKNGVWNRF